MTPHRTKDDSLGNLTKAVNFIRAERNRELNREQAIRNFEKLSRADQVNYWRKFIGRGSRGVHICFIRDDDKIQIMREIENKIK